MQSVIVVLETERTPDSEVSWRTFGRKFLEWTKDNAGSAAKIQRLGTGVFVIDDMSDPTVLSGLVATADAASIRYRGHLLDKESTWFGSWKTS